MNKILIAAFLIFGQVAHAKTTMFSQYRPMVEKYLGLDIATKIWGKKEEGIKLPKIPELVKDTKSMGVYNKEKETITYPEDQMLQYNAAFIYELIESTREVKGNRDELSRWMGTLSQGATREGVYRAMVLDTYYARLENYDSQLSESAANFAIQFMDKFTGKKVEAEKLYSLNIYSIKRIVTERALEVLDIYLSSNKSDFYDWYAVFSKDLAEQYPIWENKLRSSKSSKNHKQWAKRVPVQFVKSEVIIKLHKLFNNLQKRSSL